MPLLFNTPLCDSPPPSDEVQLVSLSSKAFSELPLGLWSILRVWCHLRSHQGLPGAHHYL